MDMNNPGNYKYIRWLEDIKSEDINAVGGKNASLGEIANELGPSGIKIPQGFAVNVDAYRDFLKLNGLEKKIQYLIQDYEYGKIDLKKAGRFIRQVLLNANLPDQLVSELQKAYNQMGKSQGQKNVKVVVRSSATAEDLPEASFAGQMESFLNISGESSLFDACKHCYASLFTDRSISYREQKGFDHMQVELCLSIQEMIPADNGASGVLYTVHKESGFPDIILLAASWGYGDNVVKGMDNPDIYLFYKHLQKENQNCLPILEKILGYKRQKFISSESGEGGLKIVDLAPEQRGSFVLENDEIEHLGNLGHMVEEHFSRPMDIEWAKNGDNGEIVILQARPITGLPNEDTEMQIYRIQEEDRPILIGNSIGDGIVSGSVCVIEKHDDLNKHSNCPILVSEMANTSWLPVLYSTGTSGLITDFGGPNSHAATISRELGIPSILGTQKATQKLKHGQHVTVVCRKGDFGLVYDGIKNYEIYKISPGQIPRTDTKIRLNLSSGQEAFQWWRLPGDGVGTVDMDYILRRYIRIHPLALIYFPEISDSLTKRHIAKISKRFKDKTEYFISIFSAQVAKIAATQYPRPVIVKLNDLSGPEFQDLIGGKHFVSNDQGKAASSPEKCPNSDISSKQTLQLQLMAISYLRNILCFDNVQVMFSNCLSLDQASFFHELLEEQGLKQDGNTFQVHMSCDHPVNIFSAREYARYFDGLSVDQLDIPNLTRDLDDSSYSDLYPPQYSNTLLKVVEDLVTAGKSQNSEITLRGWSYDLYKSLLPYLAETGLDCLSVPPEALPPVKYWLSQAEKEMNKKK